MRGTNGWVWVDKLEDEDGEREGEVGLLIGADATAGLVLRGRGRGTTRCTAVRGK